MRHDGSQRASEKNSHTCLMIKDTGLLSASIRKYGAVGDLKKCHAMLTQPFEKLRVKLLKSRLCNQALFKKTCKGFIFLVISYKIFILNYSKYNQF